MRHNRGVNVTQARDGPIRHRTPYHDGAALMRQMTTILPLPVAVAVTAVTAAGNGSGCRSRKEVIFNEEEHPRDRRGPRARRG